MRMMLAAVLATCGLAIAPRSRRLVGPRGLPAVLRPDPGFGLDRPDVHPLYSTYRWPGLAGFAVTAPTRASSSRRLRTHPLPTTPVAYAVAARAVVPKPDGQWQLQVQVMHWRGETWRGGRHARWSPSTPRWPRCADAS